MVMVAAHLAEGLAFLVPVDNEPDAIDLLAGVYRAFAEEAQAGELFLTFAGGALGETAMKAALAGMSVESAGITKIPAACLAFWTAVCANYTVSFPGSIAATPPPHASLPAAFAALMPANTAGDVTLEEAAESIADIMYADAIVGGTVTFPGPSVVPIL